MNTKFKVALISAAVVLAGCQSVNSSKNNNSDVDSDVGDIVITAPKLRTEFIRGMDISMLPEIEKLGGKYYESGAEKDLVKILKDNGVNSIRARLWVDPMSATGEVFGGGNNTLERSIELGKRAQENGMSFLLDIHYSDFWADPKKQQKPKEWEQLTFENLTKKVYDYTAEVMKAHQAAGVVPDMVQVGNELNGGMLWPEGKSWGQDGKEFDRLSLLLKTGIQAVHDNDSGKDIQIMLHLAEAGDNGLFRWWFDEITQRGVDFDVIGMSYYPWWHGPIDKVKANMNDVISRYNKPVVLVETSFPFTTENGDSLGNSYSEAGPIEGYSVSIEGQAQYLADIMTLLNELPNEQGLGIYYWEPAWLPIDGATWSTEAGMDYSGDKWDMGNSWENQALFDFEGNTLPSLKVFKGQ
ncbi:glycosyl hydrolase 53 family protein [Vibrio cholerae]|uniref:glycoside hydrolase family 53 protein n=1 Tax=Vibrio cholerae TaxID=666 RepID=UPI001372D7DE|nr:glycosyl hydrolase 53 family protein [Vibrio cholerae]EGQ8121619.1 galactosidase [Vibrio cholerae]EKF9615779.1 glycosyl hydrolase 53 family protein [Vibrio cholerae]EMA7652726.1 glycosyl hydrolase 53 family protein [Vibrio cholerae]EMB6643550.1 glycosyl hydrolase 53 family protein [Vibrio cholerae]MBJ6949040.1 glycosyl hydrolase 53 family protein [Vibrio cholerae]